MYEEFYRFGQPPFTLAPDPRFLYRSESHDEAINRLLQSIRRKEGFILLTGDIGTGKTTVCRTLLQQLDVNTFTSLILNPFLSVEELLREILLDVLAASDMRQLDQRISLRAVLNPLNREEVEAYIAHRLWVAKGADAVRFDSDAVTTVHAISAGVPRVINLLCDRALMAGSA